MVWWQNRNDDDLPPELRGKKPEELAAEVKKAKDLETKLQAAEDERKKLEDKLTATTSEFDTIKNKLTEIEAKTNRQDPPPVVEDDEPASPWTDPQKFVAEQTKGVTQVALASGMMTAKMYFVQNLSERDQKIFKKYEREVEQGVGTFTPEARVMPQAWLNCFLFVKGAHEQDIRKHENDKTDFFAETSSRTGGHNDEPDPLDKLTAEEEETCRVMHWDPKGYLERKKASQLTAHSKGASLHYGIPKSAQ